MISQLRAALLIKVFPRTGTDGRFVCLAVLYHLNEQGEVFVADMVSFGSAAVDPAKIGSVSQGTLRVLPLAPVQTQAVQVLQCPWDMDDYAMYKFQRKTLQHRRRTGGPRNV
ncbi:hypothetical protein JG687_00007804 [Phytophthora cactorum]|uniref:Uncharacterized protein n=1 Tax=Phytophthora cactorum TaxID=29920 RepID=A0A8T1UFM8_9STRA|nr:hypothetical protein PC128_g16617 [Phytophthora cactorum]KAG4050307.1 hypothetical protein PC123_g14444 [Phytophthora cactorum]KAG6961206.1 hypothetical protein JG687_00007804 [Phytophthora cactorum]